VPLFNLKSLNTRTVTDVGTSNWRHQCSIGRGNRL
jgi:hypothetical protein